MGDRGSESILSRLFKPYYSALRAVSDSVRIFSSIQVFDPLLSFFDSVSFFSFLFVRVLSVCCACREAGLLSAEVWVIFVRMYPLLSNRVVKLHLVLLIQHP
jgi:hypothetical protein